MLVLALPWQVRCAVQMPSTTGSPWAWATRAAAECPTPQRAHRCAVQGSCGTALASSAAGDSWSAARPSAVGEPTRAWHTAAFQVRSHVGLSGMEQMGSRYRCDKYSHKQTASRPWSFFPTLGLGAQHLILTASLRAGTVVISTFQMRKQVHFFFSFFPFL